MEPQGNQNSAAIQKEKEEVVTHLDFLLSQMPDHAYDWLFSNETANNVATIAKQFNLNEIQTIQLARITGMAIIKEISLPTMALELKKNLALDDITIRQIAISTALTQFLPIRDHLLGVEDFIRQLGGVVPTTLPPLLESSPAAKYQNAAPVAHPVIPKITLSQKSLRQITQENKEILNQVITTSPLMIADFDQPVRGTIKNWLADYVKQKGAEKHDQMIRGEYLFKSDNTKNLSSQEKLLVAEILKSYDENSSLNYNETEKVIIFGNPENKTTEPQKRATPTAPSTNASSVYREPIGKKDLPESVAPAPKNTSQVDGHVINLKDLQ